jgi:hypothetical protein
VELALVTSATGKGLAALLFTGVVAPLIGLVLRRVSSGWESIGGGPLAIEPRAPEGPRQVGMKPGDGEAESERRRADLIGSR